MLDLETMGLPPKGAIISMGAIPFDTDGTTGPHFHSLIDLEDCVKCGMEITPSTLLWWMGKLTFENRGEVIGGNRECLKTALIRFSDYVKQFPPGLKIWANSPNFDLALLETAYQLTGIKYPFRFNSYLDVRTIKWFGKEYGIPVSNLGNNHNSLDDCYNQIKLVTSVLNQLA